MRSLLTILPQVVLFAVFGVWLPVQKGISFLDPVVLGAYVCLGVVFSAPAVASGISVLKAVRSGLALSWGMLITGIVVVYFTRPVVVGPDLSTLAQCGLFGLALSTAVSFAVAFAATRVSVNTTKIFARLILFLLLGMFYFWSGWLPDVALMGAALCGGITVVFGLLLRRNT